MNQKKLIGTPLIELANTDNLKKIIEDMWSNQQSLASQMAEIVNFFNAAYSPSDANASFTIPVNAGNITSVNYNSGQLIIKFNTPDGPDCIKFLLNPLNDNGLPEDESEEPTSTDTNNKIIPHIVLVDWSNDARTDPLHTEDYVEDNTSMVGTAIGTTLNTETTQGKTIQVSIGDYAYAQTTIYGVGGHATTIGSIQKLSEERKWEDATDEFPNGCFCYYKNKVYLFKNASIKEVVIPTTTTIINEVDDNTKPVVDLIGYTELGNQQLDSTSFTPGGKYSFSGGTATLTESIVLPNGVTLKFLGGVIDGNYNLIGTNTTIEADHIRIFGDNISVNGNWANKVVYPEWFGAKGDAIDFGSWPMAVYNRELTAEEVAEIYEGNVGMAPSSVYPKAPDVFPNLVYLAKQEARGTKELDYSGADVYYDPIHNCFLFKQGDNWYNRWTSGINWNSYEANGAVPRLDTIYLSMEEINNEILPATGSKTNGYESSAFIFTLDNQTYSKTLLSNVCSTFTDNTPFVRKAEAFTKGTLLFDEGKVYYFKSKIFHHSTRNTSIVFTGSNKTLDANNSTFYIEGVQCAGQTTAYDKDVDVFCFYEVSDVCVKNIKITSANVYRRGAYALPSSGTYHLVNLAGANLTAFKVINSPNIKLEHIETNHIIEDVIFKTVGEGINDGFIANGYKSNTAGCFTYIGCSYSTAANKFVFLNLDLKDDEYGTNSENHLFYISGVGASGSHPHLVVVKDSALRINGKHTRPTIQGGAMSDKATNYFRHTEIVFDNCYIEGSKITGLSAISQTYKNCTLKAGSVVLDPESGAAMTDINALGSYYSSKITLEDSTLYSSRYGLITTQDSSNAYGGSTINIIRSRLISAYSDSAIKYSLNAANRVKIEDSELDLGSASLLAFNVNNKAAASWGQRNEVLIKNNIIRCKGQLVKVSTISDYVDITIEGNLIKLDADSDGNRSIIYSATSGETDIKNIKINNNHVNVNNDASTIQLVMLKSGSKRVQNVNLVNGEIVGNYVDGLTYVRDATEQEYNP